MSDITKFLGDATSSNDTEGSEPMPKKAKTSGVSQTASLKTVRNWEKELEIELGKEHNDDGVINKIWCVVCKEFGTDRSSTVSIVNLNTLYLFWYQKLI